MPFCPLHLRRQKDSAEKRPSCHAESFVRCTADQESRRAAQDKLREASRLGNGETLFAVRRTQGDIERTSSAESKKVPDPFFHQLTRRTLADILLAASI